MHAGDWIALAALIALLALIVAAGVRTRRARRAVPQRHGPSTGTPKHEQAAVTQIGTVAADAARSASG